MISTKKTKMTNSMHTYTNTQLKQALAKMLPTELQFGEPLAWKQINQNYGRLVLDTELLHLCWLAAKTLPDNKRWLLTARLANIVEEETPLVEATWQQRTIALAKMKGIEIV